jgi:argininosuccinate lyase
MPHKKNGCFELIRGKCNKIQALPYEITLITNNLPSLPRDLQLLKKVVSGNSKPENLSGHHIFSIKDKVKDNILADKNTIICLP